MTYNPEFLPRSRFQLAANTLSGGDPRFTWDARFGGSADVLDYHFGRLGIVGDYEADIKLNRLAISAPISRAIIGREPGDTVVLRSAKGSREYQILEVRFEPQE